MASSNGTPGPGSSRRRVIVFRVAAVLLAPAVLAAAELVCVAFDWGRPTEYDDPFVGFSAVRPLFVRSEDGERYEVARSRWRCFRPQSFPIVKAPNEYRIFCLGGSTVQGRPYSVETSFTTWLEMDLRLADTSRTWRVINCGGISYASYRLVPILKEVLGYKPDMIILYTGQNEFLEDREYGHIRDRPRWVAEPLELASRMRTFNLLREGYLRVIGESTHQERPRRTVLQADVEAILDYQGGLAKYHRDEQWRRGVIEHYRYNVRRMVQMCQDAGVKIVLVNPVCNLRDCPPFKSQHRDGLTDEQLKQWNLLCRQASDYSGYRDGRAIKLLRQAMAIDDQFAELHYRLAKELDDMGDMRQAKAEYIRAKELDVCPLRILEEMNDAVIEIAGQTPATMVDARDLIEQRSKNGIPGDSHLSDHVHPRIACHQLIANALFDELDRQGIVHPRPGWMDEMKEEAKQHLASLGYQYFEEGRLRLESLQGWAAGRAELPPPKPRPKKP